jgi:hypothetical protein
VILQIHDFLGIFISSIERDNQDDPQLQSDGLAGRLDRPAGPRGVTSYLLGRDGRRLAHQEGPRESSRPFWDDMTPLGPANSLRGAVRCRNPLFTDISTQLINSYRARPLKIKKSNKIGNENSWPCAYVTLRAMNFYFQFKFVLIFNSFLVKSIFNLLGVMGVMSEIETSCG